MKELDFIEIKKKETVGKKKKQEHRINLSFNITDSRNDSIFQYLTIIETPSFINVWTRIISTCPQLTQLQSDGLLHDDD